LNDIAIYVIFYFVFDFLFDFEVGLIKDWEIPLNIWLVWLHILDAKIDVVDEIVDSLFEDLVLFVISKQLVDMIVILIGMFI